MKQTITVTRQGQATIPAAMRRKLGVGKSGGVLQVEFDEQKGTMTISKPVNITELSQRLSRHIKPGTKPVRNVDEYYQAHRKAK